MLKSFNFFLIVAALGRHLTETGEAQSLNFAVARNSDDTILNGTNLRLQGIDAFEEDQSCTNRTGTTVPFGNVAKVELADVLKGGAGGSRRSRADAWGCSLLHSRARAWVRALRVAHGLSQETLAHEVCIDRTYQSQIERGAGNLSLNVLGPLLGGLFSSSALTPSAGALHGYAEPSATLLSRLESRCQYTAAQTSKISRGVTHS